MHFSEKNNEKKDIEPIISAFGQKTGNRVLHK